MALLNCSSMSDSIVLFPSDDEDSDVMNHETKQYNNLTAMLKGVPPPSSITISKFTVEEMLQKYNENKDTCGFGLTSEPAKSTPMKKNPTPFLNYLNSSQLSENIASLMQKVQERYVQLETLSTCNMWFKSTIESFGSAKKRLRMRHGIGISPDRRLSHLARRRKFFSSANLQRMANADNVRQIEIIKNENIRNERKAVTRTVEYEKLNSSKRALFMSPENGTPTKYGNTAKLEGKVFSSGSEERKKLPLQEKSKKSEILKWLSQNDFDVDFPRKRLREECANYSSERKRKCPRRSLNFADEVVPKPQPSVATSDSSNSNEKKTVVSLGKLSQNHKNKLLWAVSVVMKGNNISRNHEHFKVCASTLFHKCRKNLDEILNSQPGSGTSDKILQYAKKEMPKIFEELGIQINLPSEDMSKTGKEFRTSAFEDNVESKENVNKSNIENVDGSASIRPVQDFIFKTPRKIRRKRTVKSCQKASNGITQIKRKAIRRWHSLESLIGKDLGNCEDSAKILETEPERCGFVDSSTCVADSEKATREADRERSFDNQGSSSLMKESIQHPDKLSDSIVSETAVVLFSPIPSSVKEETDSPSILYPALCVTHTEPTHLEEEGVGNGNSFTSETEDSREIEDQDGELKRKIEKLWKSEDGVVHEESTEIEIRTEDTRKDENRSSMEGGGLKTLEGLFVATADMSFEPSVDEHLETSNLNSDCNMSLDNERSTCEVPALNEAGKGHSSEELVESVMSSSERDAVSEERRGDECFSRDGDYDDDDFRDTSTPSEEKAMYKPKKLVVKKSKPNWKVVRKNSDEADNQDELRLKMRLSHEWEIVGRNSSCSDVGTSSECEASLNCSQVSSANDEKDFSSEVEQDESNRRKSTLSSYSDERPDQDWPNHDLLPENSVQSEMQLTSLNDTNGDDVGHGGTSENPSHVQKAEISSEAGTVELDDSTEGTSIETVEVCPETSYRNARSREFPEGSKNVDGESEVEAEGEMGGSLAQCESEGPSDGEAIVNCQSTNGGMVNSPVSKDSEEPSSPLDRKRTSVESEVESIEASVLSSGASHVNRLNMEEEHVDLTSSANGSSKEVDVAGGKKSRRSKVSPTDSKQRDDCVPNYGKAGFESESSGSSHSSGRERKKRLLSLEMYKLRKQVEKQDGTGDRSSPDDSFDQCEERRSPAKEKTETRKRKIYEISLKPRHHHRRSGKQKRRHRSRNAERSERESSRFFTPYYSDSALPVVELSSDEDVANGKPLHGGGVPEQGQSTGGEASEDVGAGKGQSGDGQSIHAIIDALSTLSKLVEEQIKTENEMALKSRENQSQSIGEGQTKKNKWMDVALSWCGKNLAMINAHRSAGGFENGTAVPMNPERDARSEEGSSCANRRLDEVRSREVETSRVVQHLVQSSPSNEKISLTGDESSQETGKGSGPNVVTADSPSQTMPSDGTERSKVALGGAGNTEEAPCSVPEAKTENELYGYRFAGMGDATFNAAQSVQPRPIIDGAFPLEMVPTMVNSSGVAQQTLTHQSGGLMETGQNSVFYQSQNPSASCWPETQTCGGGFNSNGFFGVEDYHRGGSPPGSFGVSYGQPIPGAVDLQQTLHPVYNFSNSYGILQKEMVVQQPADIYSNYHWQFGAGADAWSCQPGFVAGGSIQNENFFPGQIPSVLCYYNNY